ncbi:MAG TPA: DNA-processing protein DprA, partial [Methylomirabilota bacterium]|nr:DNA-processing protein DprA [Methylomirabilota bacterium]
MNIKKLTFNSPLYPAILRNIDSPPPQLYVLGDDLEALLKLPRVAIVGTRKVTPYGTSVTQRLASELAGQGVVIISGLAYGVDALAHKSALGAGGLCIGVLPCPVDNIVPVANQRLAQRILDQGGVLVSEYESGMPPQKQYFIARNRIMSGLADAVLVTEAGEKSGSLYTSNFAIKQGRELMAVPGNITSPASVGTNNILKSFNASAVTNYKDVLNILGLNNHQTKLPNIRGRNRNEQTIL